MNAFCAIVAGVYACIPFFFFFYMHGVCLVARVRGASWHLYYAVPTDESTHVRLVCIREYCSFMSMSLHEPTLRVRLCFVTLLHRQYMYVHYPCSIACLQLTRVVPNPLARPSLASFKMNPCSYCSLLTNTVWFVALWTCVTCQTVI